jgi:dipeptidyl aminopeptidase/acylaminoacyl peptidase
VFRPSDVAFHRPIVGCSFSRDGRRVALAVPRYEASLDSRPLEVWCRDLQSEGGWERVPASDPSEPVCQPTIAPDGRRLAVLTAKAGAQLLQVFDMEDLSLPPLELRGLPLRVEAPKWCADTDELMCLGYDAEGWRRVWRWRTLDDHAEACTPAGVHAGDYAVEPSGATMAWVHLPDMLTASSERLPIRVTPLDGGGVVEHRVPGRPVGYMAWSSDGRWLAYLARRVGHRLSASRLWIVDPRRWPEDPDAARCLTRGLEGWITGFDWSHDGESVFVAITQGTYGRLERVDIQGKRTPIGNRRAYLSGPHVDRSQGRLLYLEQDGDAPQRLCLYRPDDAVGETLTDFHEPIAAMELGPVETVHWTAEDGIVLDGVLVRPPGRSEPSPMLVWLHGGPAEVISRTFSSYFQAIAAAGYAVFAPNFRGSNGRGDGFLRASIGDLGGADASDVLGGIDRMVQIGAADTERTALMGWSYGATLALLIASKSGVPRTVIAGAPVADWVSFFGAPRYPSMYRDYFPGPLWEDRGRLDAASPISHIAHVQVPTLLLHGGADGIVPCSHSRLLYRALRERGVETDLMIYPGEGHVFGRPSVVRDMLERALSWLETHLG